MRRALFTLAALLAPLAVSAATILIDGDPLCSSEQGQITPMTIQGGRWIKGQSGNPGGRPRVMRNVQELARQRTSEAVRTLGELMRSDATPPGVRVRAAELLLDRAWGRPLQSTVSANLGSDSLPTQS
jgi:hypothetical protein